MATFTIADSHADHLHDGELNLASAGDTLVWRLYADGSNIASSIDDASTITSELSTGSGYTSGGLTATNQDWTEPSTGVWMLDADDPSWTASGGSLAARYCALVDTTPATDRLIGFFDYGSNQTANDGNDWTIQLAATGIYRTANS